MSTEQPGGETEQAEVDAWEHDGEQSYARWQSLMEVIAEAARRSDALRRLERALDLGPVSR